MATLLLRCATSWTQTLQTLRLQAPTLFASGCTLMEAAAPHGATRYEHVLYLDFCCRPGSSQWFFLLAVLNLSAACGSQF
jgi:hypothetical protein